MSDKEVKDLACSICFAKGKCTHSVEPDFCLAYSFTKRVVEKLKEEEEEECQG